MNSLLENTREKGRIFKTNYFKVVVILQKGLATNLANYYMNKCPWAFSINNLKNKINSKTNLMEMLWIFLLQKVSKGEFIIIGGLEP